MAIRTNRQCLNKEAQEGEFGWDFVKSKLPQLTQTGGGLSLFIASACLVCLKVQTEYKTLWR